MRLRRLMGMIFGMMFMCLGIRMRVDKKIGHWPIFLIFD